MSKLRRLSTRGIVPVEYSDLYVRQRTGWFGRRLVAAPAASPTTLLRDLVLHTWSPPYTILYVLVVSRIEREPGRYEMTTPLHRDGLETFLHRYRAFLEGDSRHHLWVAPAGRRGQIVYDRHDLLYVYGPLRRCEALLRQRGFTPGPVSISSPHVHEYEESFDDEEAALLNGHFWRYSPLQSYDER